MSIEAGKLRHRVRIDQLVDLLDSNGDPLRDEQGALLREWQPVATVWAAIEPLSAREFIQSASTQAQITARITIRYMAGLDAAMRIVHMVFNQPGSVYNPAGFLADKDSGLEYLTIPVTAGVDVEAEIPDGPTFFLLTNNDDFLTTTSGDNLTWSN